MTVIATDSQTCEVYWIRRKQHTNIFSEGYVGITTKGVEHRFSVHKKDSKTSNYPVHNAIRKYEDIIVSTIVIGSLDYCLEVENKLRPSIRIGWNLAVGGSKTMLGWKMSEESKLKISLNNAGRSRVYSEEERLRRSIQSKGRRHTVETKINMSKIAKSRPIESILNAGKIASQRNREVFSQRPWLNPNADKTIWVLADQIYKIHLGDKSLGVRALGSILDITFSKLQCVLKKIRSGWVPNECPFWTKTFILKEE